MGVYRNDGAIRFTVDRSTAETFVSDAILVPFSFSVFSAHSPHTPNNSAVYRTTVQESRRKPRDAIAVLFGSKTRRQHSLQV